MRRLVQYNTGILKYHVQQMCTLGQVMRILSCHVVSCHIASYHATPRHEPQRNIYCHLQAEITSAFVSSSSSKSYPSRKMMRGRDQMKSNHITAEEKRGNRKRRREKEEQEERRVEAGAEQRRRGRSKGMGPMLSSAASATHCR